MNKYITLLTLFLASCGQTTAYVGGVSKHFDNKRYNEVHNNVGLHYEMNASKAVKVGLIAETYQNSFDRRTVFLGGTVSRQITTKLDAGLSAGYITGYDYLVAAFPFARYNFTEKLGARLVCLPAIVKYPAFCGASFLIKF